MFCEVFNANGVGMGPYRTTFQELEAYARVMRITIRPWEAVVIRRLTEEYVIWNDQRSRGTVAGMRPIAPDGAAVVSLFTGRGAKSPGGRPKATRKASGQ